MKRKIILSFAILLFSIFTIKTAFGQQTASPETTAAAELIRQGKWQEAENAFAEIVKKQPENARAWFNLGFARHSQEKWAAAVEAFKKNVEIAGNPAGMYNVAAGYARLDKKDEAFEWLEKAFGGGAAFGSNLSGDNDFAGIKTDARFKKMLDLEARAQKPCLYTAQARQFDFWLGDWDVFNPAGQKAGTNSIQSFAAGCGLMENWTSATGGDGKSINYYDAGTGKWYQHWIGSSGGALRYEGEFKDGAMRFSGVTVAGGKKTLNRLTFFKLDEKTVRQLAESSTDDGKTWTINYDLKYVKRK